VIETISNGLTEVDPAVRCQKAWAFIILLSGGVTTLRAIIDETISKEIINALKITAFKITEQK